jgi:HD superfamily phosphohydrolase
MFLASRLYMYLQVYHHRTGRRFDLSMREIFADTIAELLTGNPIDHPDEYLRLNDWSLFDAVQRWEEEPQRTTRRRLADSWARISARELPWHLAYETIAQRDTDLSRLHEQILDAATPGMHGARIEVDVATARVAPNNPMTESGMVNIYDPLSGTVEAERTAEMLARLPQHNQVVRVFTDRADALNAVHDAAVRALRSAA